MKSYKIMRQSVKYIPLALLGGKYVQIAILGLVDTELLQVAAGWTLQDDSLAIEARAMAWTFESEVSFFDHAPQMSTGKADRAEPFFVMDDKRRNVRQYRSASLWKIACRADIEITLWSGIGFITEKTDDACDAESAGDGKQ